MAKDIRKDWQIKSLNELKYAYKKQDRNWWKMLTTCKIDISAERDPVLLRFQLLTTQITIQYNGVFIPRKTKK